MDKKRKTVMIVITVVMSIVSSTFTMIVVSNNGCAESVVTDALGRSITVSNESERIVSLAPSITEDVYSLGLNNELIGVDSSSDHPINVTERENNGTIAVVGGYNTPDVGSIVRAFNVTDANAEKVVYIDSAVSEQVDLISKLTDLNITVVALYTGENLQQLYNDLNIIGEVSGAGPAATTLIQDLGLQISTVHDMVSSAGSDIKVGVLIWADVIDNLYYAAGSSTCIQNMINASNGNNVFSSLSGFQAVTARSILAANPDVLLIDGSMSNTGAAALLSELKSDPILSQVNAVKNGSVYILTDQASEILSHASPRVANGIELIADMLHPGQMGTALPHEIGDNYTQYLNYTNTTDICYSVETMFGTDMQCVVSGEGVFGMSVGG